MVIQQKSNDLIEVESYGTELVNNAEAKIVKLESELKAKESMISDLQNGGTGNYMFHLLFKSFDQHDLCY